MNDRFRRPRAAVLAPRPLTARIVCSRRSRLLAVPLGLLAAGAVSHAVPAGLTTSGPSATSPSAASASPISTQEPVSAKKAATPPATLVVVPEATAGAPQGQSLRVDGQGVTRCDLGEIVTGLDPHVERHFLLRNDTARVMTLTGAYASSDCLRAAVGTDPIRAVRPGDAPPDTAPHVLAPGGQMTLSVDLDTLALAAGAVDQFVWVQAQGQSSPVAALRLTGTVVPEVQVSPLTLDFGQVPPGSHPSLPLTITFHKSAGLAQARFSCADPAVRVTTVPPVASGATPASDTLAFRVTLDPAAPPHRLESRLAMVLSTGSPVPVPPVKATAPPRLPGQSLLLVPIRGEIEAAAR